MNSGRRRLLIGFWMDKMVFVQHFDYFKFILLIKLMKLLIQNDHKIRSNHLRNPRLNKIFSLFIKTELMAPCLPLPNLFKIHWIFQVI